ncbi:protein of unknown function [Nitrospina watsonii]|uniref:Uncharacterized protein n=1 Tax=Nitrospina watsonii TaxID=1323948 RepID=A0ABN8VTN1_9BACT|nr:protein of unknown function [Nitrospina watsonii]
MHDHLLFIIFNTLLIFIYYFNNGLNRHVYLKGDISGNITPHSPTIFIFSYSYWPNGRVFALFPAVT